MEEVSVMGYFRVYSIHKEVRLKAARRAGRVVCWAPYIITLKCR